MPPSDHPRLVLASASPRRRELLADAGFRFDVVPADVPEVHAPGETPERFVSRLARAKAEWVATLRPEAVVLAADTTVALGDRILGKPADEEEARSMLASLSGRTHRVWTGVAIVGPRGSEELQIGTDVHFRPLAPDEVEAYVSTGEPMDKAGAYGIQARAAGFVLAIEGSYTNVVGLPLAETIVVLRRLGVIPRAA